MPSPILHPTIYYTKRLIKTMGYSQRMALFCDFHGHSRKYNSFIYGCHDKKQPFASREFPYILEKVCRFFSYADCK